MSRPTTHCAICGKPNAPTITTQQAPRPQFTEMELRDIAFVMNQNAQRFAANQLVTQAWNERMYDVPDAPNIMFTAEQAEEHKRALAVNQQRKLESFDEDSVPDPPAIMLAKV